MAILSEQPSLIVPVEELYHGNPDRYPAVQKVKDKATLQLVNKRAGIHLKLYKEETLEGIANFKFVKDGEFELEVVLVLCLLLHYLLTIDRLGYTRVRGASRYLNTINRAK